MLTIAQVTAILSILMAFGVDGGTVNKVHDILIPPMVNIAPIVITPVQVVQTPVQDNAPVYFGSVDPTPAAVAPVPIPNWTINVSTPHGTTAQSKVGMISFQVMVQDKTGAEVKKQVTVTSDDPDVPSSFVMNATMAEQMASNNTITANQFFCVARPANGNWVLNGCPNENPVTIGTFNFTFTVEDVSKTMQITVTP